jgi:hypothetical protein
MPLKLFALLLSCVIFFSCNPNLYFPEPINTPGLKEKGEAKLTVATKPSFSGPADSSKSLSLVNLNLDGAFAISDHIGIIATYRSTHKEKKADNNLKVIGGIYDGKRYELGTGYFTGLYKKLRIEAFLGGGFGTMARNSFVNTHYNYNSKYYRLFLQPAMIIDLGEEDFNASIRFGTQFSVIDYYKFQAVEPKYWQYNRISQFFVDPFLAAEVGLRVVQFSFRGGWSIPTSDNRYGYYRIMPEWEEAFHCTFGICFSLAPSYFK